MTTEQLSTPSTSQDKAPTAAPIVIDLGKKRRKRIRALRKGKPGRLMQQLNEIIEQLYTDGVVTGGVQPIVVVVRERRRTGTRLFGM